MNCKYLYFVNYEDVSFNYFHFKTYFSKFSQIKIIINTCTSEILPFFVHNNSYSVNDINDDDQRTYGTFVTGNVNTFSSLSVQFITEKCL